MQTADVFTSARASKAPARKRRRAVGLLATLLLSTLLVIVPASPAGAIQTIAWTSAPPASANLSQTVSFSWSGTANTFLGARITGCFATYPNGGNYSLSFGGNFTTGNCNTSKVLTQSGTYPITVGFSLSTGGQMTMSWNVSVSAPTPTVYTSGNVTTTAQSVNGAPATYSAYGTDAYYGTYGAVCTPASGSTFPVGASTVQCSATNGAGKTGTSALTVTVQKYTPTLAWAPPASISYGTPFSSLMSATVSDRADAGGSFQYLDASGNPLTASTVLPAGNGQSIRAVWTPTTTAQLNAYNTAVITKTIDVLQIPQSVAFTSAPTDMTYGDAPEVVHTQGTPGGGAVLINRTPDSACIVDQVSYSTSSEAMVTITDVGPCVLTAFQMAQGPYTASPTVQHSVTVHKATPVIFLPPSGTTIYGTTLGDAVVPTTSVPGAFTYLLNGDPVSASTVVDAGPAQITVLLTPDDPSRYTTAQATMQLEVTPAATTLDVLTPSDARTYGDAAFTLDLTTDSPGTVVHTATGPCSITGSTVTITGVGECTTTSFVAATGNHQASPEVTRTFTIGRATPTITWSTPAAITYGTPLSPNQLNATVSAQIADPTVQQPMGELVYSPAPGEILDAGTHALHVSFVPFATDATLWNATSAIVELTVDKASPVITWAAPSAITYGTPLGADQLNASTDAAGTLEYSPAAGEVLDAGDHLLVVTFTSNDPNHLSGVTGVPLTVAKATQAIDFDITGSHTYGDAPFTVSATGGGSTSPVTFAAVPGSICAVVDATVTITGAGPCVIAASQAGDANHLPAPVVTRSATVDPAVPTITWAAPAGITYGTALDATQLNASITEADATGAISYFLADGVTPADDVVLHAGDDQVLTAVFAPDADGSANYVPTAATVTIDVAQAPQVITFDALDGATFGDEPFTVAATGGGSGLPVTFASTGDACSVNGSTVTVARAGSCTITASQAGDADHLAADDVLHDLVVAKAAQTIGLGAIADRTFGDAAFTVDVTPGASGAPVLLAADGTCAVSGLEVTILHAGTCTITANQGAGDDHLAAEPVAVTFAIAKATQAIAFAPLTPTGTATYLDAALEATVSGGASGEPVVLTASGAACAVVGTTVTIAHAGSCELTASQAGTADHLAAADVVQTLTVAKFQPAISWSPSGLTYGDPIGDAQLNAASSPEVTGSITYSVEPGTILAAGTHELTATFTPDLGDDVAGVTATVTVTVDRATQTITFGPIESRTFGEAPFAVHATGGASGQPVTFSSGTADCTATTDGTIAVLAAGTCAISADQLGDGNFDAAPTVTQFFGVDKATPAITWAPPAPITYGTPLGDDQLVAIAGVDGTFTYTPAAGTVLHASSTPQTLTVRFDPTNTDDYLPVVLTTTIVVDRAAQVVTLAPVADHTFGDAPFTVSATGGASGEPVVLGATGDCTVAGDTVTITGAGACTITADQAGAADHLAAPQVTRTFAIAKGAGSVALAAIADRAYGSDPFDAVVTAGPLGGAVTLTATGGCIVTPTGQVSATEAGSCSVTATQAEGRNVLAATATQTFTVTSAPQVLVFAALADRTYGDAAFPLTVTPGASGQPVTFTATGGACTVAGSTVTVVAAGTCTITASQAGGPLHGAATPVSRTLTVNKATIVVTPAAAVRSYRQANPTFTHTLTGFVGGDSSAAITTAPTCTTTATVDSPVGRYPITCAGGASASYGFTYKTANLTVGHMPTRLAITNPATAVAGPTTISATLTDALTGAPVMGEPVLLSADLTVRSATSSPASTTVTLSSGVHVLGALYVGDANHLPAIDGQLLVSYTPTRFVIWGGNTDGVQVGRDYTFHGSQWSKQVKQGTYGAGSSFKGFATNLNAAGTSWTTTTGSTTGLPAQVGDVISVLVSTSITKSGSTITGNATKQVLLVVDDPNDYRPNGNGTYEGTLLTSL